VISTTSVSRPQLKSNPQGDRVMHNNSQGKKQKVEDHRRSVKLSKNKTSVTAFAKPIKRTVASESNKKPRNFTRKIYEHLVEIVLFIVDYGCSKHMTRNLKLLINFVEKFLGTFKFGNDQITPTLGYGDLTMALNYDSLSLVNQRQANVTQADRTVTTSNELDLLFSLMFDELHNGYSKVVSKSSA
nr:integrase, catalytic region, zinc finger, CCHC-type, peptidase aspartic, catalytic [Tanacetum cinerariifolium]